MSMVQQAIEVGAPLHTVYEQFTAFQDYPRFMTGVQRVTPIDADRTHWVMDLDGQRREFDARITELALDERVAWSATDGPLLAETITLRPLGETRTRVVAELEADAGEEALARRLKDDLITFKSICERSLQEAGRSSTVSGTAPVSPASVAARIKRRTTMVPQPAAGWGAGDLTGTAGPGEPPEDRRGGGGDRLVPGAGTRSGSAPMGGRTPAKDLWGDGLISEEDRGGEHDF